MSDFDDEVDGLPYDLSGNHYISSKNNQRSMLQAEMGVTVDQSDPLDRTMDASRN